MNILFLCTSNVNRSRTAEDYFKSIDLVNVYRSAGLSEKYCARNHSTLCSPKLLEWADKVYVMESEHVKRIEAHTGRRYLKKVFNLEIQDIYEYMDSSLIEILRERVSHTT